MILSMISIEVTTKCNLKCINCFAHADGKTYSDIDYDTAVSILNEGRELGYTLLSITGGEPFLWSRTVELMSYAKSIGYKKFIVNSNGHLFTEELCNKLLIFGDELDISCTVNGNRAEHDRVRGNGSYTKVIEAITMAIDFGLNILIYCVVSKRNLHDIPKFTESMFRKFSALKSLVFIQLRGIDDGYYNVDGLKLDPSEFIEMVKMVGYLALVGYPVWILENSLSSVVADKLGFKWLPGSPEISREGKIIVLKDGIITDNHSSLENLGSYFYGAIKETISSEEYLELTASESKLCSNCDYLSLCRASNKLRPSDEFHNNGDNSVFYCQKVLELI